MEYMIDLHTHTIASGHGYSTLKENIDYAKQKGIKVLGMSEHATALPGGPHPYFLQNYKCIPREHDGLQLLCGVEANIIDFDGTLDVDAETFHMMDYCIASMHVPCVTPGTKEENTNAAIKAMHNPYVKILGHPDDARFPLDYKKLVEAAVKENVLLEVNNSSLHPKSVRIGAHDNLKEMLHYCIAYHCMIILGSDSHICYTIGDFTEADRLLNELNFPKELIFNTNLDNISKILNIIE